MSKTQINPQTDALVIIDIQNDFCPGGALAVNDGHTIIPGVKAFAREFNTVVLTQDFHPAGHASFASTHNFAPFATTEMPYGQQTLWPDHCVQGTKGAEFHAGLYAPDMVAGELLARPSLMERACAIIRKGMNPDVDSYSAFFENDQKTATGLAGFLRERGIERVFCVGLAYDFCVGYSAIDAKREGFEAVVVKDLARAIGMPLDVGTTIDAIEAQFSKVGVQVAQAADFAPKATSPSPR